MCVNITFFKYLFYGVFMFAEISATLSSLKNAKDLLSNIRDSVKTKGFEREINKAYEALIAVYNDFASVQLKQSELIDKITTLKEENRSFKEKISKLQEWETEKPNYELVKWDAKVPPAYMKKEHCKDYNSFPLYCTNCFENNKISVLHYIKYPNNSVRFAQCTGCGFKYDS